MSLTTTRAMYTYGSLHTVTVISFKVAPFISHILLTDKSCIGHHHHLPSYSITNDMIITNLVGL